MEILIVVALLLPIYFLPAIIAGQRQHHNTGAIFAVNLFFGWTLLGWLLAIVWACTATTAAAQAPVPLPLRTVLTLDPAAAEVAAALIEGERVTLVRDGSGWAIDTAAGARLGTLSPDDARGVASWAGTGTRVRATLGPRNGARLAVDLVPYRP